MLYLHFLWNAVSEINYIFSWYVPIMEDIRSPKIHEYKNYLLPNKVALLHQFIPLQCLWLLSRQFNWNMKSMIHYQNPFRLIILYRFRLHESVTLEIVTSRKSQSTEAKHNLIMNWDSFHQIHFFYLCWVYLCAVLTNQKENNVWLL